MKHVVFRVSFTAMAVLIVFASSTPAQAVTGQGMKACEIAILQLPKFHDLPMAAVSVYPGQKNNHAHFTIRWDGLKADGNCKVDEDGYVQKVNVKNIHDKRKAHDQTKDWSNTGGLDGFYYDRHVTQWRDPGGRVCHTCTPDNGFPDHSRGHHHNNRPKNEYERMMQKQMKNMLSDEDIRNLNALGQ